MVMESGGPFQRLNLERRMTGDEQIVLPTYCVREFVKVCSRPLLVGYWRGNYDRSGRMVWLTNEAGLPPSPVHVRARARGLCHAAAAAAVVLARVEAGVDPIYSCEMCA